MNDFENRLEQALMTGAESAPGAAGLAAGARARRRQRRRRLVAASAVASVLAIALPATVVGLRGDDGPGPRRGLDPIQPAQPITDVSAWHTVRHDGEPFVESGDGTVLIDVPADWERVDTSGCEFEWVRFGPTDADPCDGDRAGVALYGSATFDPMHGPGLLVEGDSSPPLVGGYVHTGQYAVYVSGTDEAVARRVLGSARPDGVEIPDLSRAWRTQTLAGIDVAAPPSGVEVDVSAPNRSSPAVGFAVSERRNDRWRGQLRLDRAHLVEVDAPTQALAELVASSARLTSGWPSLEVDGVIVDVPDGWSAQVMCQGPDASRPTIGPSGADCRDVPGAFVYAEATFDPAYGREPQPCADAETDAGDGKDAGWCGYVVAGDRAVFVRGVDRATLERILDSVRVA